MLTLKVEVDKYRKAVEWAHQLLFKSVLTPERVRIIASKMMSDVSRCKRNGQKVVQAAIRDLNFSKGNGLYFRPLLNMLHMLPTMFSFNSIFDSSLAETVTKHG